MKRWPWIELWRKTRDIDGWQREKSPFQAVVGIWAHSKCLPGRRWVRSLGREDPLEKGMATHSRMLAWKIPWTEEPGGLQSLGSQRVRLVLSTKQQQKRCVAVVRLFCCDSVLALIVCSSCFDYLWHEASEIDFMFSLLPCHRLEFYSGSLIMGVRHVKQWKFIQHKA